MAKGHVNWSAYNSVEAAADINDLRRALGLASMNLFGVGYGSRVALTAMRDFPDLARSAILDAPVPLEANLLEDMAPNADEALTQLFALCAADQQCHAKYPDIARDFARAVANLDANPPYTTFKTKGGGETYRLAFDTGSMVTTVIHYIFDDSGTGYALELIHELAQGDYRLASRDQEYEATALLTDREGNILTQGAYFSFLCSEEAPFNSPDVARQSMQRTRHGIELSIGATVEELLAVCPQWGTSAASSSETQPVSSTVPTLIARSEINPLSPARYATAIHAVLPNSTIVTFPGVGNPSVLRNKDCGLSVANSFFSDPSVQPATACLASLT